MSFNRLTSLEAQVPGREDDDDEYHDDPEFLRLTQSLSGPLVELTSNISFLSQQVELLGSHRDNERLRERIHTLLEDTREICRSAGEGIKKVQAWEDVTPSQKWTQQKLSGEFKACLERFQTVQREALDKERASAVAARTALQEAESQGYHHEPTEFEAHEWGQEHLLEQQQSNLASQDEVDFQESLIIEREAEIRNIEQSVGELNELFSDVAHIVHSQGEHMDLISENVERTRDDTRGAHVELRGASKHQKKSRNRMFCLLIILTIILLIIILAAVS